MRDGISLTGGRGCEPQMEWPRALLFKKRIACASTLLDRVHGAQGDFDRRSKIVATMINATGLHAS